MSQPTDDSAPDLVGLILGALAFSAALGVGLQGLVTWTVRTMQRSVPAAGAPALSSGPALMLLVGTLAGIVAAGLAAWSLLVPIRNPWRQAMLSLVAALGSFVLSLVTLPIDRAFGRSGLLGLTGAAGLLCLVIGRRLPRAFKRA